jgi:PAS domain-containing protein
MEHFDSDSESHPQNPSYAELKYSVLKLEKDKEALRESEERYRTIFSNSPVGIFRSTFEGRFLDVNPALALMLGYDSPEDVLQNIYSIKDQIYQDSENAPRLPPDI